MGSFEVNFIKLKISLNELDAVYKDLIAKKAQIDKCTDNLYCCIGSGSYSNVKKNLKKVSLDLEQQIAHIKSLSIGLDNISNTYSKTESNISSVKVVVKKDILDNKSKTLKTIDDIAKLYEKYYKEPLSDGARKFIEGLYKGILEKTVLKDIPDMLKFLEKIHKGDYAGAAFYLVEKAGLVLNPNSTINYTGLKVRAIGKTFGLVFKPNGYITVNDEKYRQKMEEALGKGNFLGVIWNGAGSYIQTVGKGTVQVFCGLASDTLDAIVSKATHGFCTVSELNALIKDYAGWSPGHFFNDYTKAISYGVDTVIDKGGDFLDVLAKQSYSNIAEFGNIVGKAGKGIVCGTKSVVSAIVDLF